MDEILKKICSIELCLSAHPDNEEDSEFADRISDLQELPNEIRFEVNKTHLQGVLTGLRLCKEMWAQGTISHELIRENEIYYESELENFKD